MCAQFDEEDLDAPAPRWPVLPDGSIDPAGVELAREIARVLEERDRPSPQPQPRPRAPG